ncbi:MAG TPA: flagellin [Symbiobacteriaceae bacterium]|nr:flagellin [Symbiobacteriaceae bacterium]
MRINTNMAALNAWRNMTSNNTNMQKSLEKLSSGFRINRAADDAAGLAVSEKMRAQIRGTNQSIKNSQDGISLLQTAEGALTEVHSMLQRMRELSVQSSTSTLQDTDRALLQEEFSQLQSEITRIGNSTQFNGKNLLDGSSGVSLSATNSNVSNMSGTGDTTAGTYNITASVKATNAEAWLAASTGAGNATAFGSANAAFTGAGNITVNGKTYSVTTSTTAQNFIDAVNADSSTTGVTASFDTGSIKFTSTTVGSAAEVNVTSSIGDGVSNVSAADSQAQATAGATVTDSGVDATMTMTQANTYVAEGNKITVTSGAAKGLQFSIATAGAVDVTAGTNGSLSIQTGAQAGQALSVSIADMRSSALGINTLSVGTQAGASSSITTLDTAINTVSTQRAKLGALQNRLEYTVASQSTTSENLSAAESRIRDVDMASEMAQFTKYQILSQASTAMLSQANQSTQGVLSLLR